jgi:hypothetical protein
MNPMMRKANAAGVTMVIMKDQMAKNPSWYGS